MKLSRKDVAEMPPIQYQAQVVAWQKGRDDVTDEDVRQAEKMVARWNLTRIKRQQKVIV